MTYTDKDAFQKGYKDHEKCDGQADPNPLTELFHPSYAPPSGHEEAYREGWDMAKENDK